jgi:hypothetical protein
VATLVESLHSSVVTRFLTSFHPTGHVYRSHLLATASRLRSVIPRTTYMIHRPKLDVARNSVLGITFQSTRSTLVLRNTY